MRDLIIDEGRPFSDTIDRRYRGSFVVDKDLDDSGEYRLFMIQDVHNSRIKEVSGHWVKKVSDGEYQWSPANERIRNLRIHLPKSTLSNTSIGPLALKVSPIRQWRRAITLDMLSRFLVPRNIGIGSNLNDMESVQRLFNPSFGSIGKFTKGGGQVISKNLAIVSHRQYKVPILCYRSHIAGFMEDNGEFSVINEYSMLIDELEELGGKVCQKI